MSSGNRVIELIIYCHWLQSHSLRWDKHNPEFQPEVTLKQKDWQIVPETDEASLDETDEDRARNWFLTFDEPKHADMDLINQNN